MTPAVYALVSALLVLMLAGIRLMISPRTAAAGNRLGAVAVLAAVAVVLVQQNAVSLRVLALSLVVGTALGLLLALNVTTLRIPQFVALLNGTGGLASLLVAVVVAYEQPGAAMVDRIACVLAILVGGVTFSGSMVAAGKLEGRIRQQPVTLPAHSVMSLLLIAVMAGCAVAFALTHGPVREWIGLGAAAVSLVFGVVFAIRIGGADMPITISLLNSYSGLAVAVCGFAIRDILLIASGGIVGAAGLWLTRIMCRAMNRSLMDILTGRTAYAAGPKAAPAQPAGPPAPAKAADDSARVVELLRSAKRVIVVPGYGMALAQAQQQVKKLYDTLCARGADVVFAIHPVAGRMPGHMNVLLAEVDIPYEKLRELDDINPQFAQTDLVLVIGACDVVNEAAITAKGTPIYGMPVLHAHEAKAVVICNLDTRPGYSGVPNPLYARPNVTLLLGNAAKTLERLLALAG